VCKSTCAAPRRVHSSVRARVGAESRRGVAAHCACADVRGRARARASAGGLRRRRAEGQCQVQGYRVMRWRRGARSHEREGCRHLCGCAAGAREALRPWAAGAGPRRRRAELHQRRRGALTRRHDGRAIVPNAGEGYGHGRVGGLRATMGWIWSGRDWQTSADSAKLCTHDV
jgi:hypothetical protein